MQVQNSFILLSAVLAINSTPSSTFRLSLVRPSVLLSRQTKTTFELLRGGSSLPSPPLPIEDGTLASSIGTDNMGYNAKPPGFLRSIFPSFPWYRVPNYLTYVRVIAIPGIVFQFYLSKLPLKNVHTSLIFSIASITDYLDGYLARRWDITSSFGAFLDPVADKLMVSTALILLSGKYGPLVAIPSTMILAREIAVSALREWMASQGKRDIVKVGFQGKVKTAFTMLALTIVLAIPDGCVIGNIRNLWEIIASLGIVFLYLSAVVTITSGSVYFRAAAPLLMGKEE